jgi:MFS family permease
MLREFGGASETLMTEHPDIMHPPLYPAMLAAAFSIVKPSFAVGTGSRDIFRPEQWVIIPFNHLCTLIAGLLLFLVARELFEKRVAVLATALYFLSNSVWSMSILGIGIPLATAWVLAAIYCCVLAVQGREADPASKMWILQFVLSIFFCILAGLTRYGTAVIAGALALYIGLSFKDRRGAYATIFVLAFLLGVSPWMVRNKMISGAFFGMAPQVALNGDDPTLENTYERSLHPDTRKGVIFAQVRARTVRNFLRYYNGEARAPGDGLVALLFFATFFYRFARDPAHRLRWGLLLAFVTLVGLGAVLGDPTIRLLYILWPMMLVYGAAFFYVLLDRLQLRLPILRYAVAGVFLVLTALPLVLTLMLPRAAIPYPPYYPPYISHICRMLSEDELLCTDLPWATAWYGNRNSVALPRTIDEFYEIHFKTRLISGLYFTTVTRDRPYVRSLANGEFRSWFPILEGRIPGDFPLTQGFGLPVNSPHSDQLFLTDRARWKEMER